MNTTRADIQRRVEQAWGSTLLTDYVAVARKRDEAVRSAGQLADRFYQDFQRATGQGLELHQYQKRWGIVFQRHILTSIKQLLVAYDAPTVKKIFGRVPTEAEFRQFMDLVTLQIQINEGQE